MKKILFILSISLLIVGCSTTQEDEEIIESEPIEANPIIETVDENKTVEVSMTNKEPIESKAFKDNSEITEPKYKISDSDYAKYNNIMDYLDTYPEYSEDELFKRLESEYGQSAEELEDFMNSNMQNAIDRDFGKTIN